MLDLIKKHILLPLCTLLSVGTFAQNGFRLNGHIIESKTGFKIELASVQLLELNRWTTSNNQGDFIFNNVPAGKYTLQVVCLGYEKNELPISINSSVTEVTVVMQQSSLALEEVVVIAREHTSMSSSSKIESTALTHVQPSSLADVMQLVPGQITLNPNMSSSNQITIRDINTASKPDNNSAMGTAIVLDGTPLNNDANLQTLNTAGSGTIQAYSTSGQGIDLRKIPTDNIESVEVIRGIPSVEYGDLTTGIVLVRTKAGKSKLHAGIKTDPKIKQLTLSKGFLLPGTKNGALNIDVDYAHSYDDLRKPSKSYKRLTGQLGYSNTLFTDSKPLSINVKINYYNTLDKAKNDPDLLREEILQEKEENAGLKLFGKWSVRKPWLNNISYNFSGDYTKQEVFEHRVTTNAGATALPTAMVSGEAVGSILPTRYISDLRIDGQPFNFYGVVKGTVANDFGKASNNLMVGAEWKSAGNNGAGKIYDLTKPPTGASSTRPRAFNDIPMSRDLAFYAEDLFVLPIGSGSLKSQFGIRYNNMLPKGLFTTDGFINLEPRINITYDLFQKREDLLMQDLSFHGGYGKTSKNPSMIFMYPDKSYQDEMSFNYYPDLIVITTKVITDTSNPALKPISNTKFEAGVDMKVKGIKVSVTGFSEKIINGYTWESQFFAMEYNKWDQVWGIGKQPQYQNGAITYVENGTTKTLPYAKKQEFHYYNSPQNNYDVTKKGIEYILNFGKLKSLKTTLMVDGAYYHIQKTENVAPYQERPNASYLGEKFPYVALMPGGKGNLKQRLNSNINITTHLPKVRMIVSVKAQIIWIDKTAYYWNYQGQNVAYTLNSNNEKIYGQYEQASKVYVDPVGYLDKQMQYHAWQSANSFQMPFSFLVNSLYNNYFTTESYPVTWQINLKLTKEIGDRAQFSFYANNLLNQRPIYRTARADSYVRMNQTAYFGAELKLVF